jgi:hypothetical protein
MGDELTIAVVFWSMKVPRLVATGYLFLLIIPDFADGTNASMQGPLFTTK